MTIRAVALALAVWMDRTPVTNAEFERFVKVTGFITVVTHIVRTHEIQANDSSGD